MKNTKTSEVKAHADFGASGSKRWLNCSASVQLSRGMPNYESKYAQEGTDAHACLEFILKNRKNIFLAATNAYKKWPREMVNHAYESAKYIMELMQNPNAEMFIETKIDSSSFTTKDQFSTLDVAVAHYNARNLHIIDYKYGAGLAVYPEDNPQLIYYAIAMMLKLGWKKFDKATLTIIQPRKECEKGEVIRSWVIDDEELLKWGKKFKLGVKAALAPNAPIKAGDWCQFCNAKIKCPALREESFKEAGADFDVVEEDIKHLPAVRDIKNVGKLLSACEKLQIFINAVKERAYEDAKRGLKVEGYKLVPQRTSRQWKNEHQAMKKAKAVLGEEAFTAPKLLSPAQFEKKFKKTKSAMKWLDQNVEKKPGGVTLAKDSDKRKATSIIDADFEIIEG